MVCLNLWRWKLGFSHRGLEVGCWPPSNLQEKCVFLDRLRKGCWRLLAVIEWNWWQRRCCVTDLLVIASRLQRLSVACMEDADLSTLANFLTSGGENAAQVRTRDRAFKLSCGFWKKLVAALRLNFYFESKSSVSAQWAISIFHPNYRQLGNLLSTRPISKRFSVLCYILVCDQFLTATTTSNLLTVWLEQNLFLHHFI